jgi:hypothetical protein
MGSLLHIIIVFCIVYFCLLLFVLSIVFAMDYSYLIPPVFDRTIQLCYTNIQICLMLMTIVCYCHTKHQFQLTQCNFMVRWQRLFHLDIQWLDYLYLIPRVFDLTIKLCHTNIQTCLVLRAHNSQYEDKQT